MVLFQIISNDEATLFAMRQNWQMWQGAIQADACEEIIQRYRKQVAIQATTFNQHGNLGANSLRKSNVRWVEDSKIREMLWWFAREANRSAFGLDVTDVGAVQFTEYTEQYEGKYGWHHDIDWNNNAAFDRKISVVLQLTDGEQYEGCEFTFDEVENPERNALRKKGTVLCFPSYLRHSVSQITKGERFSLVAWFEGPRWR